MLLRCKSIRFTTRPPSLPRHRRCSGLVTSLAALVAVGGCPSRSAPPADDVIVSLLNVTDFEARVLVSGIVGDVADVGEELVEPLGSTSVAFTCLDELVIGDPFDPEAPGAIIIVDAETEIELDPFALRGGTDFFCGEIIQIVISGDTPETLDIHIFALDPS
jgi:hypothetical protein